MARLRREQLSVKAAAKSARLAIELREGAAKFALVHRGSRPRVEYVEERTWDAANPKGLQRAAKELRAADYECTSLLSPAQYNLLLVDAPALPPQELRLAMRWKIKDMVDYRPEEATLDVIEIPTGGLAQQRTAYVVAARTELIRTLIAQYEAARLPVRVIDIPEMAQRNIAALFETEGRSLLTISFDEGGALVTITSAGNLLFARRLDLSWQQLDVAESERAPAYERLLVEIQRSLDHFERASAAVAVEKVLLGPAPDAEAMVTHLSPNLYLPISQLRLEDVMDLPARFLQALAPEQAGWLRLIGAGLRAQDGPA